MLQDSEYAKRAYEKMRNVVERGSRPLPEWRDLQHTERELLIRMFILGAEHVCAEILRPKVVTRGSVRF